MKKTWLSAVIVGICGNLCAVAAAALVFREPPGSAIRPMDIPLYIFWIALATAVCGVFLAIKSFVKERLIALPLVSALLCSLPIFSGFFAFHYFVDTFRYTLKP